jgi:hypothetical protein
MTMGMRMPMIIMVPPNPCPMHHCIDTHTCH